MLERHGSHRGFDWIIMFSSIGHRCGYVCIPKDNPLYGKNAEYFEFVNCHGGINIATDEFNGSKSDEWIIGFDCAHFPMDAVDLESIKRYYGQKEYDERVANPLNMLSGHTWTADEVEEELNNVIDQLIAHVPEEDVKFFKELDKIEQDFLSKK